MADGNNGGAPAGSGAIDLAKLQETLNTLTSTVTQLATAQADQGKAVKILADTIDADKKAAQEAAAAAAATSGKGDDKKPAGLTEERLLAILDQRDSQRAEKTAASAKRSAFVAEKLKDLPAVYQDRLGGDESKWASEEQAIRSQFQNDMKALGVTPKNLGSQTNPGGQQPSTQVDESKLTGMEMLDKAVAATSANTLSAGEQTVAVVEAK